MRCSKVLPCKIMDVFKTLCDGAYRQIYDVNIDETTYMKKICANVTVLY
jgi:hypothetical protein